AKHFLTADGLVSLASLSLMGAGLPWNLEVLAVEAGIELVCPLAVEKVPHVRADALPVLVGIELAKKIQRYKPSWAPVEACAAILQIEDADAAHAIAEHRGVLERSTDGVHEVDKTSLERLAQLLVLEKRLPVQEIGDHGTVGIHLHLLREKTPN